MQENKPLARERIVRLLLLITDRPNTYTKKQLAEKFACDADTIKADFQFMKNAGLSLEYDDNWCYHIKEDKQYKQLKDLLHFTEEDQFLLFQAIDQIDPHGKRGAILKKKLGSLYNYKQLGHSYLRKPYLKKVDALLQAKSEKKQIILKNYTSSSSDKVSDRLVEAFHIDPAADTIQAFDADKGQLRHFRISRLSQVIIQEQAWQNETKQQTQLTDPFRIVDNNQIPIHIRLRTGAYNELIERFPLAKSYIIKDDDAYDFQCNVNHRFIGITNFILGNYHQLIEVVFPDSLSEHLMEEMKKMKF
jgi:predicted DNA-binding transcriptional regulator YafY